MSDTKPSLVRSKSTDYPRRFGITGFLSLFARAPKLCESPLRFSYFLRTYKSARKTFGTAVLRDTFDLGTG